MRSRRQTDREGRAICIGFVVVPRAGQLALARDQLAREPRVTLGPAKDGRVPGCAITTIGDDRELIAELEALDPVLAVEVVYAETLHEER